MKPFRRALSVFAAGLSLAVTSMWLTGCASEETLRAREEAAFQAGQVQALTRQQTPAVTVLGNVARSRIEWTDGLTLVRALIQAEWLGGGDPRVIVLRRPEATFNIAPGELFRAQEEGPVLRPGDVIELRP